MAAAALERFRDRLRGRRDLDGESADLVSNAAPFHTLSPGSPDAQTGTHRIHMSDELPAQGTSTANPSSTSNSWGRGALSLFERSNPHKGIERYGIPLLQTIKHYIINDPFTTLLNAPRGRFIAVFFCLYMTTYFFFSIVYTMFPSHCMNEPTRNFGHAFWFSFQTASTIGYSGDPGMYPDPDCNLFNLVVMVEIIFASLLDYCLMGAVFARFAAPLPKAQAIRFSSSALLHQPHSKGGLWHFSFRMASIRKHSLLKPEISLLLAVPEGARDPSNAALRFLELQVEDVISQTANLRLGLPIIVVHVVSPNSPLFNLSLEQMESEGLEIICFLDGMDPMTSNSVQARHSYRPSDVRMNEVFTAIGLQANWRGQMGLDFTQFDITVPKTSSSSTLAGEDPYSYGHGPLSPGGQGQGTSLRSQTLRSLSVLDPSVLNPAAADPLSASGPVNGHESVASTSRDPGPIGPTEGDPLGALSIGRQQHISLTPQIAAFIQGVLADPAAGSELKRKAALLLSGGAVPVLQPPGQQRHQSPFSMPLSGVGGSSNATRKEPEIAPAGPLHGGMISNDLLNP